MSGNHPHSQPAKRRTSKQIGSKPNVIELPPRITQMPGASNVWLDPSIISCVRVEYPPTEGAAPFVVVHTSQGFAIALAPDAEHSAIDIAADVLRMIPK